MISTVEDAIKPYQKELIDHKLYSKIKTPQDLITFMEYHVYAVWDFMSLLKALQNQLTCTTIPWIPVGNPNARYLINEIVLAEETDINIYGQRQSHYEMYLDAMDNAGASTSNILNFVKSIQYSSIENTVASTNLPKEVIDFLRFTFQTIEEGKPHCIAAAFTFGREDLIPDMFTEIINNIQQHFPEKDLTLFKYYFDRHIELDGDEHGPMALEMVSELCGNNALYWEEAVQTSITALKVRKQLWDGIEKAIDCKILV